MGKKNIYRKWGKGKKRTGAVRPYSSSEEIDPALWHFEREQAVDMPERLLWLAVCERAIHDSRHFQRALKFGRCTGKNSLWTRGRLLMELDKLWEWAYGGGVASLEWIAESLTDDPEGFVQKVRARL